jgi:hypothetical protein
MNDLLASLGALLIPLILGVSLVRIAASGDDLSPVFGHRVGLLGVGYLAGLLAVTGLLRLLSAVGIPFSFLAVSLLAGLLIVAVAVLSKGLRRRVAWHIEPDAPESRLVVLVATVLLTLIAIRLAMATAEVVWRPLYPWDAWAQWATKAQAWFASGRLAPFVWPHEWLAMRGELVFTDQAPQYPATVPLIQVWHALALGRFDESWVNLPWVAAGAALLAAFHGQLHALGFRTLPAMLATYALASLPFLNTHMALAGYAELFIAAYYGVGAMLWIRAIESLPAGRSEWMKALRHSPTARLFALALVFAIALPFIKRPGIFWALSFAAPVVVLLLPRVGAWLLLVATGVAVTLLLILSQTGARILNYQIVGDTNFAEVTRSLLQNFFAMGNWHLYWYLFIAAMVLALRSLWKPRHDAYTAMVGYGFAFLACVFYFSVAGDWVSDFTTVNRAIIHMLPLTAFYAMAVLRERFPSWLKVPYVSPRDPVTPQSASGKPSPSDLPSLRAEDDSVPAFAPVLTPARPAEVTASRPSAQSKR